jgi:hypothetical protein
MSSGKSCTGVGYPRSRKYCVTAKFEVFRATDLIIFETEPQDALPDVFFENNLSFGIDIDGNHLGNIQNQNITGNTPGIVDTEFFNCFSFGNGAESYKIRDSIIGRSFNFGERVTTVAEQDYKEADRFADITYSGNYNQETNVNRLNEFNKGLSNYKNCEASFGEIFVLDGRETDVLVLQEDKISYVLAEKNLLSDASAGGIITATPAVRSTGIPAGRKAESKTALKAETIASTKSLDSFSLGQIRPRNAAPAAASSPKSAGLPITEPSSAPAAVNSAQNTNT